MTLKYLAVYKYAKHNHVSTHAYQTLENDIHNYNYIYAYNTQINDSIHNVTQMYIKNTKLQKKPQVYRKIDIFRREKNRKDANVWHF